MRGKNIVKDEVEDPCVGPKDEVISFPDWRIHLAWPMGMKPCP